MDFGDAINEHRELQRRNAALEPRLPLAGYRARVPSRDGGLFDQQTETADEETRDLPTAGPASAEPGRDDEASLLWDIPSLFEDE